ncbi:hypothetical protein FNO01nite_11940 [Flavobacterium noncentrifugens]|uniref:Phage shock protein C (PspC) family protein n=1 Tax=Flavobacterium noncentrifugens TaxID=1128970 RepID=A0A1G8VIG5_9FLAO|nr:PspC domain-containing protein [Flavobacterium noncentrifugens]GEP50522.1 hypothetical protein FNO01nite_11940 [Flavobacterium noncentrifugens]SDJ65838.1 phage shock protein C (PspC) family protein [Flavobacterium noncentrifugens]
MNKTVNINLGGMFFHIDEDAYQKLTRYFDAIKRSLSNSNGQDEIIKDIEMRIAELVTEKHSNDKQVINVKEVEEIIIIMGQPEDYRIDNDDEQPKSDAFSTVKRSKKLYRDKDKGMIGGVAAGLGHYFGIDAVWIRILLVLFVWLGGSGIIAYIVLWIVMPEAVTTSEKLEMTGEPVTISNIERKVREEFDNVSQKFKNVNYDEMGNQVKTGAERFAGSISEVFMSIFKVFAKVLGAIIVIIAATTLGGMLIGLFTVGSTSFVDLPWQNYAEAVNYTNLPLWVITVLGFFAIGIPFFFLFILGLKLLVQNMKSIGSIAKYTLLALWLICVGILISLGIKQATEIAFDGKVVMKENVSIAPTDTLYVKFRFNDYYAKDIDHNHDFMFTQDENNNELIYSNDIEFNVLKTDEKTPYIQIEKRAEGKSLMEAKHRAEKIKYGYKIEGNHLIFDNYLTSEVANKYRNQKVEIFLYLPEGTLLKPDSSIQDYDRSDDSFFNLHYSGDYLYKLENAQVKCLTCPPGENDFDDTENLEDAETSEDTTASVILNKDGILIKKSGHADENKEVKSVKINKDGIIIKTE